MKQCRGPTVFSQETVGRVCVRVPCELLNITEFHGVSFGSAQDQPHTHLKPLRGPPAPRREPNLLPQAPGLGSGIDEILLLDMPHETFSGIPHLWLCPHRASRTPLRDTLLHDLLVVGEGE